MIITPRTPALDATGRIERQEAGFYYLRAPDYHSDPCVRPSLSNSICRILAQESPLHAHHAHPRLNPNWRYGDSSSELELGSAIHKLVLGRGAEIARLPFNDYKKNEAKEARREAPLAGLTPLIEKKYAHAESVAEGLHESVSHWLGMPVTEALTELVVIAEIDGLYFRIMIDAITPDLSRWCDVKSTAMSCASETVSRHLYSSDYHVQAAFYEHVLNHVDRRQAGLRQMAFLFGEVTAPYATSRPIQITEAGLELGRSIVRRGIRLWRECLASGQWPGYGSEPAYAEPPVYLLSQMANEDLSAEQESPLTTEETS